MNIVGIDPGIATIGLGVVASTTPQDIQLVDFATIETKAGLPIGQRLCEIQEDLDAYITQYMPALIVIEQIFFAVNERTIIPVAQARGVIVQTCASKQIPLLEPTPLQLKQAITGDGSADKLQVQTMVQTMLNLEHIPKPDDAADGLALAIYGAIHGSADVELND